MHNADERSPYREFQKCSISWCYEHLFGKTPNTTRRFLVADEVGLGKTLVARGLIDELQLKRPRRFLKIVYVCSSLDIINQNRAQLDPKLLGTAQKDNRITLIRAYPEPRQKLQLYFLTPNTSLFIENAVGLMSERIYMAWLAKRMFQLSDSRVIQIFQCKALSFGDRFCNLQRGKFQQLSKQDWAKLRVAWAEHGKTIRHGDPNTFSKTVKAMRLQLAKILLESLKPDLIILDEFQRFRDILLEQDNTRKHLCPHLLRPGAPTMLLSATPYRLLSPSGAVGGADDVNPYKEFRDVLRFLTGSKEQAVSLVRRVSEYGKRIRSLTDEGWREALPTLLKEKQALEGDLTKYLSRTERVFFQQEENHQVFTKFLSDTPTTNKITRDEIKEFLFLAKDAPGGELLAYWKSGAFLMSYLQRYQLREKLRQSKIVSGNRFLYTKLNGEDLRSRKVAYVANDIFGTEQSHKYLWIPPLRPYYDGKGIYSKDVLQHTKIKKGLVFSAWKFVPREVAAELSQFHNSKLPRLRTKYQMKVTPVTWASFFFPSWKLADYLTHDEFVSLGDVEKLKRVVEQKLTSDLRDLKVTIRKGSGGAKPWEVLRYLEFSKDQPRWRNVLSFYRKRVSRSRFKEKRNPGHLIEPRYLASLNKPFSDSLVVSNRTIRQLAEIAITSPAVAMLRSLITIAPSILGDCDRWEILQHICLIELRSFINRATTGQCVRSMYPRGAYSRSIADYFRDGNIQAVLDEFAFCVGGDAGPEGISEKQIEKLLHNLRCVFQYHKSELRPYKGKFARHRVRTNVAMAFGESQDEGLSRDDLRIAFNSPFWPFVLATTSVGQEGLDFHLYCKNIYHWNILPNPVDFEQREGRLNRYNSLTVRNSVMSLLDGDVQPYQSGTGSVWHRAFSGAHRHCHYNDRYNLGLSPNWICTPSHQTLDSQFVRHILDLPYSSDKERYKKLISKLRLYRLALGQPNPDVYLKQLEHNGVLDKIDARSLYLNLFPFKAINQRERIDKILREQERVKLLLQDAEKKNAELPKATDRSTLQRWVTEALNIVRGEMHDSDLRRLRRPIIRGIIEAIFDFVNVHDKINDLVPSIGYQDDLSRLKVAVHAYRNGGNALAKDC